MGWCAVVQGFLKNWERIESASFFFPVFWLFHVACWISITLTRDGAEPPQRQSQILTMRSPGNCLKAFFKWNLSLAFNKAKLQKLQATDYPPSELAFRCPESKGEKRCQPHRCRREKPAPHFPPQNPALLPRAQKCFCPAVPAGFFFLNGNHSKISWAN